MLANLHTHSTYCDGKNTPEEIVLTAIDKGFSSIGFSGHGYTPYDLRYCMKDTLGYKKEVLRLKEAYRDKIQVYLGLEEDAFAPANREDFDYIIGSSHYLKVDGEYYPIDSGRSYFEKCLEIFNYDVIGLANAYYTAFCDYIAYRKPDIIGHFDLITKFDELSTPRFLNNAEYNRIAEGAVLRAAKAGCIFEVNTGAISRGYRTSPYPYENLLRLLKNEGARVIVTTDCHKAENLDFSIEETQRYLYDIGFRCDYVLYDGQFIKNKLAFGG